MADYWIKLYHEILDDPKMATLPDRLYRRIIEVLLLAGRYSTDKSGNIPCTKQLAWALRMDETELQNDLEELEAITGFLKKTEDGWFVTNFEKRQSAATSTERSQKHRERQKKQQYYDSATQIQRNVPQNTEQNRTETDDQAAAVFRSYEENIGMLVPAIVGKLEQDLIDYPQPWIIEAIEISAQMEKRNLAYVDAILKRWKQEGKSNGSKPKIDHGLLDAQKKLAELERRNAA